MVQNFLPFMLFVLLFHGYLIDIITCTFCHMVAITLLLLGKLSEARVLMLTGTNLCGSSLMCQELPFFWSVICDKFPTFERIYSWYVGSTRSLWLFCNKSIESCSHLFFEWSVSNQVCSKGLQLCWIHRTPRIWDYECCWIKQAA